MGQIKSNSLGIYFSELCDEESSIFGTIDELSEIISRYKSWVIFMKLIFELFPFSIFFIWKINLTILAGNDYLVNYDVFLAPLILNNLLTINLTSFGFMSVMDPSLLTNDCLV